MTRQFPREIFPNLGYYVYRLLDPRNGQTFYIGKGKDNRLFQHLLHAETLVHEAEEGDEDAESLKLQTILDIKRAGLEPIHVVQRHGLDESTAFEVEAALIDAFPALSNLVTGHGSGERGCRHAEQLIRMYAAPPLDVRENLILIYVGKAVQEGRSVYDAVRCAWKMSLVRAQARKLVLAYDDSGLVIGAYRPTKWWPATREHFPFLPHDLSGRIGFEGQEADDVWSLYYGRRPPRRKKGAQSPFSYLDCAEKSND